MICTLPGARGVATEVDGCGAKGAGEGRRHGEVNSFGCIGESRELGGPDGIELGAGGLRVVPMSRVKAGRRIAHRRCRR